MKCLARQHSDQMICHQCGLLWDVNDPEPPVCGREVGQGLSGACKRFADACNEAGRAVTQHVADDVSHLVIGGLEYTQLTLERFVARMKR